MHNNLHKYIYAHPCRKRVHEISVWPVSTREQREPRLVHSHVRSFVTRETRPPPLPETRRGTMQRSGVYQNHTSNSAVERGREPAQVGPAGGVSRCRKRSLLMSPHRPFSRGTHGHQGILYRSELCIKTLNVIIFPSFMHSKALKSMGNGAVQSYRFLT